MKKKKLLVFCLDALCTYDLEYMKTLPHFKKFFEDGSVIKHIEPIYPSFTYPCHCAIITGNTAGKHGVPHNAIVSVEDEDAPWYCMRSSLKCDTIMDVAKRNGFSTCSLSWPVSGGADIDLNMPMIIPLNYNGDNPLQFLEGTSTQELLDRYYWKHGRYIKGKDRNLDLYTMALAADIIQDYHQPDVMLVKMCDLDTVRHINGVKNDLVKEQLKKHDEELGVLLESVKRYGDYENTNFVVLGDHGQQDVTKTLNMNLVLKENGFIRTDENGKIVDYDAYCHSVSLSAWIQLKNPEDKEMHDKVYKFLLDLKEDPIYNIGYVFTKQEVKDQYGLEGPLDFVNEGRETMTFGSTLKELDFFRAYLPEGQHATKASHGHLPFRDETTTFMAFGPSVKKGVVIERSKMINEAPTMAAMLGFEMKDVDGEVLTEILK